jgi:hypothetical protein
MRLVFPPTRIFVAGVLAGALCLYSQDTPPKDARPVPPQGIPPRTTPADYQAHAKAGAVTIGAEFIGHSFLTPQGTLTTEEYVVVETGLFGEPGARIVLSLDDFSLRVNGKKTPLPSVPYGMVTRSLKDPDWEPPTPPSSSKSKTSLSTGGESAGEPKTSPTPIRVPVEVQRQWAQRAQKASLAQGDRALPQAGLLFFLYRGKTSSIRSIDLIYSGPGGQATLALQP